MAKPEAEDDDDDSEEESSSESEDEGKAGGKRKRSDKDAVARAAHVKKGVRGRDLLLWSGLDKTDSAALSASAPICAQAKKIWDTLVHCGVTFPPAYEPHGVKLVYDGKPVTLSPAEEEVRAHLDIAERPELPADGSARAGGDVFRRYERDGLCTETGLY